MSLFQSLVLQAGRHPSVVWFGNQSCVILLNICFSMIPENNSVQVEQQQKWEFSSLSDTKSL